MLRKPLLFLIALAYSLPLWPQTANEVCRACIRANMEFLASDALRGRGSSTPDEFLAVTYAATEFQRAGVAPAGENGTYVQMATYQNQSAKDAPIISFNASGQAVTWKHGEQVAFLRLAKPTATGPLQKSTLDDKALKPAEVKPGAFLLFSADPQISYADLRTKLTPYESTPAAAILVNLPDAVKPMFSRLGGRLPRLPRRMERVNSDQPALVLLDEPAVKQANSLSDGAEMTLKAEVAPAQVSHTWNAVARIDGTQPNEVVLLSAHIDHLGVGQPVNGDEIYNGADDDASGSTAVLELARELAKAPRPRRTVIFVLFGSEELGGIGNQYFMLHPPVPMKDVIANLEFEMIGRADAAVKPDELWLTGWERSNLGPTLAQHGAHLVGDPHPTENFFMRSDNYALARKGVVAQTVSSFGLHADYHRPSDELSKIDFNHMDEAIGSMVKPIEWLINSDFKPEWLPGKKP